MGEHECYYEANPKLFAILLTFYSDTYAVEGDSLPSCFGRIGFRKAFFFSIIICFQWKEAEMYVDRLCDPIWGNGLDQME